MFSRCSSICSTALTSFVSVSGVKVSSYVGFGSVFGSVDGTDYRPGPQGEFGRVR
jgi:hypothetical protein